VLLLVIFLLEACYAGSVTDYGGVVEFHAYDHSAWVAATVHLNLICFEFTIITHRFSLFYH
jgi:hypothetical protein